MINSEFMVYL